MPNKLTPQEELERIKRGTVEIIDVSSLLDRLKERRPLRIKAGFDPSTSDIHLGHVVLLKKLRLFQDLGHRVCFIIGDFTARIGDPSGRDMTRSPLSKEEVLRNASTYTQQAFKILDARKTEILFNSSWFDKMNLSSFCEILSRYTVARILERDDFKNRFQNNRPITMLEFIYPLLQGYDSVVLKADVEIGGNDQKFNLVCARNIQSSFGQEPQVVITLPLLIGLDGKNKMSKSLGNYIGVAEHPQEIFGKVMSISDSLMYQWYEVLTEEDLDRIKRMHPRDAKLGLAQKITSWFYTQKEALKQRQNFEEVFSKRKLPQELREFKIPLEGLKVIDIIYQEGIIKSRNQIRRLIKQGGVEFNNEKILQEDAIIKVEGILRIGKKDFLKITPSD